MRSRDAVGKKITAIHQSRHWSDEYNGWIVELDRIVLDDGTELYPTATELHGAYAVELHAVKPKRKVTP